MVNDEVCSARNPLHHDVPPSSLCNCNYITCHGEKACCKDINYLDHKLVRLDFLLSRDEGTPAADAALRHCRQSWQPEKYTAITIQKNVMVEAVGSVSVLSFVLHAEVNLGVRDLYRLPYLWGGR